MQNFDITQLNDFIEITEDVRALATSACRIEITEFGRDKSTAKLTFVEDCGECKPKNATFTNEPTGAFEALYTREYWEETYPKGERITLRQEGKRWQKIAIAEDEFIEEIKQDSQQHYYNMVLTDKDEWCFAPTFVERLKMESLEMTLYKKGYSYECNYGRITVTHNGNVNFDKLEEFPKFTKFANNGDVTVEEIGKVHENTTFVNKGCVKIYSLGELAKNATFANKGDVLVQNIKKFSTNTTFVNKGYVNLYNLKKLAKYTTFANDGGVYVSSVKKLPKNAAFHNEGGVYMDSLKKMPKNVTFANNGDVRLDYVKKISKWAKFSNNGSVFLDRLQKMSKFIEFANNGKIYLHDLKKQVKLLDKIEKQKD